MKLSKISAICALACAALSGQAFAATALNAAHKAIVDSAVSNNRVIFISGASAVQKGFGAIAASLISSPIRFANTSASSKDFEAYAGPLVSAAGGWAAGTNVVVIYRVKGGSVFGVDPVARDAAIQSLDVNSSSTACISGLGTSASPYVCTTTSNISPDAGVSDVAPALFDGLYNTEGETAAAALSVDELALLNPKPIYSLAFGVPITGNVPLVHLNRAAVSAIMTGNIGTWDKVDASLPADDILICRRVPGSGTQAVENMYFGNYPCGNASGTFQSPLDREASFADGNVPGTIWDRANNKFTVPAANTGGVVVIENSTSGDVRNCLAAAASATVAIPATYATKDRSGNAITVTIKGPKKAIGVLSMDSITSSTTASGWQFRSLDGAGTLTQPSGAGTTPVATGTGKFPTLDNLVNGSWDMQGWVSMNVPTRTTGDKAAFIDNFVAAAGEPAVLGSINDLKYVAAAIPGNGAITTGANLLRVSYSNGNQCAPLNRNN